MNEEPWGIVHENMDVPLAGIGRVGLALRQRLLIGRHAAGIGFLHGYGVVVRRLVGRSGSCSRSATAGSHAGRGLRGAHGSVFAHSRISRWRFILKADDLEV